MNRRVQLVDVFHDQPFSGNPLAVVLDAAGIDTNRMQSITRWMNFSETSFLLPPTHPDADYHVRIFTLERELPFAGHPTLGSCHAWLSAGGKPKKPGTIVQECGAGLIPLELDHGRLSFGAPKLLRTGPVDEDKLVEIASVLRFPRSEILDSHWVDNGPGWVAVLLPSADAVLKVQAVASHPTAIDIGLVGLYPAGSPLLYEVRALFSDHKGALLEDPVTGSLNASVAQWLLRTGRVKAPYVVGQGTCLGRAGRVFIRQDDAGQVWVGGNTTTLSAGEGEF
jgi:PhzF family phenazine biosynthesis protein